MGLGLVIEGGGSKGRNILLTMQALGSHWEDGELARGQAALDEPTRATGKHSVLVLCHTLQLGAFELGYACPGAAPLDRRGAGSGVCGANVTWFGQPRL